jgi:hypothetical protein
VHDVPIFIDAVAEVQGLEGPFSFPEKLLQKIWSLGDFDLDHAATTDGRAVRVRHPGRWNRLGGPDFKGAHLLLGGEEANGDVEVHLHERDWAAHAHSTDAAYDAVALHVVLFPSAEKYSSGREGRRIPVLVLLPLLHRDLEDYAADDVVESLAERLTTRAPAELAGMAAVEFERLLRDCAEMRWRQKVHFAGLRLARLGWEGACHYAALEILGYRFNRTPMLRIAARWPLPAWRTDGGPDAEAWTAEEGRWSLQGVRPANHPRWRLRQYAAWARGQPDWPARLETLARALPLAGGDEAGRPTADFRRVYALAKLRRRLADEICGGAIGGARLDNVICDGFWPLLAARGVDGLFARWFHWRPGDSPPHLFWTLRALGGFTYRVRPICHGFTQGLLNWTVARDIFDDHKGCGT